MTISLQHRELIIEFVTQRGGRANLETGEILNAAGEPIKIRSAGHNYPRVRLRKDGKFYFILQKAIVAYVAYGEKAFAPDITIVNIDGDKHNCKAKNLALVCSESVELLKTAQEQVKEQLADTEKLAMSFSQSMVDLLNLQQVQDKQARKNPHLRAAMVRIIEQLGFIIENEAVRLAGELYEAPLTAFQYDSAADLLAWQLLEFLGQGDFERSSTKEIHVPVTRGHQISAAHASSWFKVDYDPENEPTMFVDGQELKISIQPLFHASAETLDDPETWQDWHCLADTPLEAREKLLAYISKK